MLPVHFTEMLPGFQVLVAPVGMILLYLVMAVSFTLLFMILPIPVLSKRYTGA
jgi:hypothetical protein